MKKHSLIFHPFTIFLFSLLGPFLAIFTFIRFDFYGLGNGRSLMMFIITALLCFTVMGITFVLKYFHKIHQLYNLQETFLSSFTHELKTPLASIKLYLETFQRHDLTKIEQKEFIDFMLSDVKRLSNNIQQILQIGRLESKKYQYSRQTTGLEIFIKRFLEENNNYLTGDLGGEIQFTNNSLVPIAYPINNTLFDILLMNLFSNSFKYRGNQKPKVNLSLNCKQRIISLTFQDNGLGLKKKDFKTIFNKFYQVQSGSTQQSTGTGLGLYIVKQIVKLHGGKITAWSSGPGQGSTFTILFPYHKKWAFELEQKEQAYE